MHKVPAFLGCSNIPAMLYVSRLWWRDGREKGGFKAVDHTKVVSQMIGLGYFRVTRRANLVAGALPGTACFTTPKT